MTIQFVLSLWDVINFFIIAAGIGISGLSIIQIGKSPVNKQIKRYFSVFLWLVIAYVTMYLIRMLINGNPGDAVRITLRIVTLTEFMVSGFMTFMLILMIQYSSLQGLPSNGQHGSHRGYWLLTSSCLSLQALPICITILTKTMSITVQSCISSRMCSRSSC